MSGIEEGIEKAFKIYTLGDRTILIRGVTDGKGGVDGIEEATIREVHGVRRRPRRYGIVFEEACAAVKARLE